MKLSNRETKEILAKIVNPSRMDWAQKHDSALCAYRTIFKVPIGMSPYEFVFGKSCYLPIKLKQKELWALQRLNIDGKDASMLRIDQLHDINEFYLRAYESSTI